LRTFATSLGAGLIAAMVCASPSAAGVGTGAAALRAIAQDDPYIEVAVRRRAVVDPRGGAAARTAATGRRGAARRTTVIGRRGGVAQTRIVVRPGAWVQPAPYRWPPGGPIAAGAAVGVVAGRAATIWAGPPPARNLCWYMTVAGSRQGFWDSCR
jgi:hypothetical protein